MLMPVNMRNGRSNIYKQQSWPRVDGSKRRTCHELCEHHEFHTQEPIYPGIACSIYPVSPIARGHITAAWAKTIGVFLGLRKVASD